MGSGSRVQDLGFLGFRIEGFRVFGCVRGSVDANYSCHGRASVRLPEHPNPLLGKLRAKKRLSKGLLPDLSAPSAVIRTLGLTKDDLICGNPKP